MSHEIRLIGLNPLIKATFWLPTMLSTKPPAEFAGADDDGQDDDQELPRLPYA
jgi:hypothetical protein